jgi:molecular chaperone GrpE (heat shock protein)
VKSEVLPISVRAGDAYDPLCMKAVGRVKSSDDDGEDTPSQLVVAEQCLAGYNMGEHCLRPAEVNLIMQKPISQSK